MSNHESYSAMPSRSAFRLMRLKKLRFGGAINIGSKKTTSTMHRIEEVAKVITNLSIIFGIFITGVTLLHAQQEKRIDRTIDYRKDFDSRYISKYSAISNKFDDTFGSNLVQNPELKLAARPIRANPDSKPSNKSGQKNEVSKHDILYGSDQCRKRDVILEFFSEKENRHDLEDLINFYDYLWTCVRNHSCDRNASIELFKKDSKELFHKAAFYIFWVQKDANDDDYGEGLEAISKLDREWFIFRMLPELNFSTPRRAEKKTC